MRSGVSYRHTNKLSPRIGGKIGATRSSALMTFTAIYRKRGCRTVLAAIFDRTYLNCDEIGRVARICPECKEQKDIKGRERHVIALAEKMKCGVRAEIDGAPCTRQRPTAATIVKPRRKRLVNISLRSETRRIYPSSGGHIGRCS